MFFKITMVFVLLAACAKPPIYGHRPPLNETYTVAIKELSVGCTRLCTYYLDFTIVGNDTLEVNCRAGEREFNQMPQALIDEFSTGETRVIRNEREMRGPTNFQYVLKNKKKEYILKVVKEGETRYLMIKAKGRKDTFEWKGLFSAYFEKRRKDN